MVQVNLRNENYDKAIRHGVTNVTEWINKCAEKELAILDACTIPKPTEPCAVDLREIGRKKQ